jgi:hypothetical protein
MTPFQIINKAQSLGVRLNLSEKKTLQFSGTRNSIHEMLPLLKKHKQELLQWFEFNHLFNYISKFYGWEQEDHNSWSENLIQHPKLVIYCLRALKRSWDDGSFGVLTQKHWIEDNE